jgi:hypothetical protein
MAIPVAEPGLRLNIPTPKGATIDYETVSKGFQQFLETPLRLEEPLKHLFCLVVSLFSRLPPRQRSVQEDLDSVCKALSQQECFALRAQDK